MAQAYDQLLGRLKQEDERLKVSLGYLIGLECSSVVEYLLACMRTWGGERSWGERRKQKGRREERGIHIPTSNNTTSLSKEGVITN